jgi:hypothetical protein
MHTIEQRELVTIIITHSGYAIVYKGVSRIKVNYTISTIEHTIRTINTTHSIRTIQQHASRNVCFSILHSLKAVTTWC